MWYYSLFLTPLMNFHYLFIFINLNDFHQLKFNWKAFLNYIIPLLKFDCNFTFRLFYYPLIIWIWNIYKVAIIQHILMKRI